MPAASEIQPWILPLALTSVLSEAVYELPLAASATERPLAANPFVDLLGENESDWAQGDLAFKATVPVTPPLPTAKSNGLPLICCSEDLDQLQRYLDSPLPGPLAGKPLRCLAVWEATCGGAEFMRFGVLGYWKDPVASPARLRAQKAGHQRKFSPVEEIEFLKLLQKQIDDGTVVVVPLDWPAYTCPVHTVPKKGGKWRLVWDGRAVNAEQISIHFRMEGVETAQDIMLPRDWGCKIDLESAFNHVWVSLEMQRFYCFRYADKAYSYVGMPFGSKQAPRLFTEALGYAIRFIRETWDVRIIVYMDDILIL
jgi:hypothetical protein